MFCAMRPERSAYENQKLHCSCVIRDTVPSPAKQAAHSRETGVVGRRSFLRKMGIAGASLAPVTALLLNEGKALAQEFGRGLTEGDVKQIRRLSNLTQLTLDTSWYTRYRSTENPDFGDQFSSPFPIVNRPAIPLNDTDTPPTTDLTPPLTTRDAIRMQAIADTAAFHFATIEQGGSSLYGSFIPMATSRVVLRILYAVGGSEVAHFQTWHDKAGNAVSMPLAPLTDPTDPQVTFPDLNSPPFGGEAFTTNLIMPEPCDFISENLPDCSIIRPTLRKNAGPLAVVAFLTNMGLFIGQSQEFFDTLKAIAREADRARRQLQNAEDQREED